MILVFYILLILSAIFKALMDSLQFHYNRIRLGFMTNHPKYWNPAISWENKYKWAEGKPKWVGWILQNPLVFITDGWHLSQFLFLNLLLGASLFFEPIFSSLETPLLFMLDFLIYRLLFGVVFTIFYIYIWVLMKPKKRHEKTT